MLRHLDRKTRLLGVILTLVTLVCIVLTSIYSQGIVYPLMFLFIWLVSIIVIAQINMDKTFLSKRLDRFKREVLLADDSRTKELNNRFSGLIDLGDERLCESFKEMSVKLENSLDDKFDYALDHFSQKQKKLEKKISYEIPYITKGLVEGLEQSNRNIIDEIGKNQLTNSATLERTLLNFSDRISLQDRQSSSLPANVPTRNLSFNNGSKNIVTTFGRGAAAVHADPERSSKIFSRIKLQHEFRLFLLGSDKLERHLSNELEIPVTTLHPSAGGYEIDNALSDSTIQAIPILIIETEALDEGIWASSLSSSGTRMYRTIGEIAGTIREKQGFSFLVGRGNSANTFSSSLETIVDSCITKKEFEEDWASDAELRIPRLLQEYLKEREK